MAGGIVASGGGSIPDAQGVYPLIVEEVPHHFLVILKLVPIGGLCYRHVGRTEQGMELAREAGSEDEQTATPESKYLRGHCDSVRMPCTTKLGELTRSGDLSR